MGKPEGFVEHYLVKLAKERKYKYFKFTSPSQDGVPDRCLIGNGYTIFVELKAAGKKPRKLQREVMRDMYRCGANVATIDTRTDVDRLFAAVDSKTFRRDDFPFDV